MSTIAATKSGFGTRPAGGVNRRAFLAGGTATTALVAGAVIVFLSLATYVAFNGLPGGEAVDSDATVLVGPGGGVAPEAAATAVAAAPDAVAAEPAAPTAVAPALPTASTETAIGTGDQPRGETRLGGGEPNGNTGGGGLPPATTQLGVLGGTVHGLEGAASHLGLDVPLGEGTTGLTVPLDDTVKSTLNNVGGMLGNPDLGDQLTANLNQVTGGLLARGGLTDRLLGAR